MYFFTHKTLIHFPAMIYKICPILDESDKKTEIKLCVYKLFGNEKETTPLLTC